jgi:hypothetical protein
MARICTSVGPAAGVAATGGGTGTAGAVAHPANANANPSTQTLIADLCFASRDFSNVTA